MAEDMHEVFNMNGMYHHGLASDICIDLPYLPPTFLCTELSPAITLSLFRLQNLLYWASHIPIYHYTEDCLLSHKHRREDSDSPIHVFHSRSLERYVPSGHHLLLPASISTITCIILAYLPPIPLGFV